MLQAATTGHPGICTIHANDVFFLLRFGGFAAKTQQKRR
ncbi:CpaF/VirB11 family protein [Candidatus Viridilinea mediisalina]|nr:CpaF/VirB11 family protein [Candidatus Viridilinea mediisalina]